MKDNARFVIKESVVEEFRGKYKNSYVAKTLGMSDTYVSLIFHRRVEIPKMTAFAFTKALDSSLEIDDVFEEVK